MLESCSNLAGNTKHVTFLADEFPFYTQTKSSLYMKETVGSFGSQVESKALNCRFGMKAVMATNHFDGELNFITVLSGERRYILSHPKLSKYGIIPIWSSKCTPFCSRLGTSRFTRISRIFGSKRQ